MIPANAELFMLVSWCGPSPPRSRPDLRRPGRCVTSARRASATWKWRLRPGSRAGSPPHSRLRYSVLMRAWPALLCAVLVAGAPAARAAETALDAAAAGRFAKLALACIHREYPNKIAHVLDGDADVQPPRSL